MYLPIKVFRLYSIFYNVYYNLKSLSTYWLFIDTSMCVLSVVTMYTVGVEGYKNAVCVDFPWAVPKYICRFYP